MGDAIRRIYNLKGNKLVISVNYLALQFASFFFFLLSFFVFVYLYQRPPKDQTIVFVSFLLEGVIVNLCQLSFLGMIYKICQKAFNTQEDMRKSNDTSLITGTGTGTGQGHSSAMEHSSSLNEEFLDRNERENYGLYGPTKMVTDVADILERSKSQTNTEIRHVFSGSLETYETGMLDYILILTKS